MKGDQVTGSKAHVLSADCASKLYKEIGEKGYTVGDINVDVFCVQPAFRYRISVIHSHMVARGLKVWGCLADGSGFILHFDDKKQPVTATIQVI